MINKIQIQNFQSLEKVILELGQFTVILGESDLGKSATIRAVFALANNIPGTDAIRRGSSRSAVRVTADDAVVTWIKDKSATYRLGSGNNEQAFEKTGRSVPDEIATALRLGRVEAGDISFDPNFHMQWDEPFLVAAKPSERAKVLGKLSGVTTLTLATQEARRREQSAKRLLDTRLGDIRSIDSQLDTFGFLDERLQSLDKLRELTRSCAEAEAKVNRIGSIVRESQRASTSISDIELSVNKARAGLAAYEKLGEPPAEALRRAAAAGGAVAAVRAAAGPLRLARERVRELRRAVAACAAELENYKTCPTCGRPLDD